MAEILAAIILLMVSAGGRSLLRGDDSLLVEDRFFGSFENATRLMVDARGFIFVVDERAHSVLVFDSPDHVPRVLGGYGWDQTTFDRPTGVATDVLNIYVSDFGNHRVNRYDRQLTFLSSLSTRDTSFERARFGYPRGVALSAQGDLFVLDGENARVVKFTASSRFERSFGDTETPEGRLQKPIDLLISHDGNVDVLEEDRILEYDYSGNFISVLRSPALVGSRGFCASQNGFLVVTASQILCFDQNHVLVWSEKVQEVVSSHPLASLQDIAISKDSIILLTPTCAGVFHLVPAK